MLTQSSPMTRVSLIPITDTQSSLQAEGPERSVLCDQALALVCNDAALSAGHGLVERL